MLDASEFARFLHLLNLAACSIKLLNYACLFLATVCMHVCSFVAVLASHSTCCSACVPRVCLHACSLSAVAVSQPCATRLDSADHDLDAYSKRMESEFRRR